MNKNSGKGDLNLRISSPWNGTDRDMSDIYHLILSTSSKSNSHPVKLFFTFKGNHDFTLPTKGPAGFLETRSHGGW